MSAWIVVAALTGDRIARLPVIARHQLAAVEAAHAAFGDALTRCRARRVAARRAPLSPLPLTH